MSWDGNVREVGKSTMGVPQGSALSPGLFLGWMALILEEMEGRIMTGVPGMAVEFPSYVDELHCELYDK